MRGLRALVPHVPRTLRVSAPPMLLSLMCFRASLPCALRALVSHVFPVLCVLVLHMPCVLRVIIAIIIKNFFFWHNTASQNPTNSFQAKKIKANYKLGKMKVLKDTSQQSFKFHNKFLSFPYIFIN